MASPFRLFRKYQASLLVVAGVLLMFVFVIGDPLMSYIGSSDPSGGSGGPRPGDVAVRWDGGKLTNAELNQLVMRRRVLNALQRQVHNEGYMEASSGARSSVPPLRVEPLELPERSDQSVEQDIVLRRILADAAHSLGMQVTDEQAVRYLQQLGRGYLGIEQLRAIISRLRVGGGSASVDYVLDGLKEELLARNYLASYWFARFTVSPEQRWKDWLSMNDRVVVEAAAIPIERFLVDVPEPTEDELTAFFDKYKDREPQPDRVLGLEMPSPLPGFAVPRKVELQFVAAEYDMFLEKAMAEVTDEEIEKFYEDNKDPLFERATTDLLEGIIGDAANQVDGATDEAAEEPAGDDGEDAEAAPADGEQSSDLRAKRQNPFRLVAFAEDEADDEATADEADESTAESATAVADTAGAIGASESTKEFQTLEEVRDEIRRTIAQLKVDEQLAKLMGKLESDLDAQYASYLGAVLDADEDGKDPPPPPPELADLTALAEANGLGYQKTLPISALELASLPIGATHRTEEENVPPEQRIRFRYLGFARDWELYKPLSLQDTDNNRYLVMKTADVPGRVPKLAEVRDEVANAWRRQQAAELALAHAEAEAKKADSDESLEEQFADDEHVTVTKTDFFSQLTAGTVSPRTGAVQSFRLSQPDGIENADYELMEVVFGLGEGEVRAALNHDYSIAYLLRVVEHELSPAELQQAFLSEADTWYGLQVWASSHAQQATGVLVIEILKSAGVDWQRPADQPFFEEPEE